MIEYKSGDVLAEDAEALVNTVNCVGVMGRGVALQFKRAWPENFKEYAAACERGDVIPGRLFIHETKQLVNPRYIINFPTKRHWRSKSRLKDIEMGLDALVQEVRARDIRSIALPPLGSGLGGLEWSEVRRRIEQRLGGLKNTRVILFEPSGTPAEGVGGRTKEVPAMTTGRAVLVELMQRYLQGLMDPSISLLEVHKLMYLMQEAGEPLRLRLAKGPYGPYAENLRNVLAAIEGHFVTGYGAGGDMPYKPLDVVPSAVEGAADVLKERPKTRSRFERVSNLIEGFESPFGLELLATVHWVITREQAKTDEDIVSRTYEWHERKRQFTREQILLASGSLRERHFLEVST